MAIRATSSSESFRNAMIFWVLASSYGFRRPCSTSLTKLTETPSSSATSLRVSSLLSPIRLDLRNCPYLIFFSRIVFPFFLLFITQIRPFLGIAEYKNTPPRNRRIPVRFGVSLLYHWIYYLAREVSNIFSMLSAVIFPVFFSTLFAMSGTCCNADVLKVVLPHPVVCFMVEHLT